MATRKRTSTSSGAAPKKRATTKRAPKKSAAAVETASVPVASAAAPAPAPEANPAWLTAVRAAESKKAENIRVLDLREATAFADFFVICTGSNPKQVQAIAEEIDVQLAKRGERAKSLEGYQNAEWILADYSDMIVHVFSQKARDFYQLERLWNQAVDVVIPPA